MYWKTTSQADYVLLQKSTAEQFALPLTYYLKLKPHPPESKEEPNPVEELRFVLQS